MQWETIESVGVIKNYSTNSSGKLRADVQVLNTGFDGFNSNESFLARLLFDQLMEINPGDTISFTATIIPISEIRNPLQFDYKSYLKSRGIEVQLMIDEVYGLTKNQSIWTWSWWQNQTKEILESNFSEISDPLAKALLLGFKQDLDRETKKAFSRAGLSHIMAVSGLHVGFIVAPFWIIIPYIRRLKFGREIGLFIIISSLLIYAGLTGFTASVMRASVTATFLTFGKLFNKSPNSINLTAAAAIFLLFVDPSDLFNIGFQLSFSAVFIILLILPVIQNYFPYWFRVKWYAKPLMVIIVSIVVQFGLYPLQVYYFGEISIISPISNALFVPLLGFLIPLALLGTILSPIFPFVGSLLSTPLDYMLLLMHQFVLKAATMDWAWHEIKSFQILLFPFWVALILSIASFKIPSIRWKLLIACFSIFSLLQVQNLIEKHSPNHITLTYFDVGQGDAALIQTPNGKNVLVDTGIWRPNSNSASSILLPYFDEVGITKLDAIFLSHPHADHIGGILELITAIEIDTIYNSGYEYESILYHNYHALAKKNGVPIKSLRAGDQPKIDPSILFLVLAPEGGIFNSDPNQHSLVLEVIHGDSEFLFMGDAGESQEERILENYSELVNTDVLKVGHHGSKTSSGNDLISVTSPDFSIISLAERNRFNHPHPEAIQRILESTTELLYTSRDRAIILKSDGNRIWQETWKN